MMSPGNQGVFPVLERGDFFKEFWYFTANENEFFFKGVLCTVLCDLVGCQDRSEEF